MHKMSNTDSSPQAAGMHEQATLSPTEHAALEESLLPFATWEAERQQPDPLEYVLADDC